MHSVFSERPTSRIYLKSLLDSSWKLFSVERRKYFAFALILLCYTVCLVTKSRATISANEKQTQQQSPHARNDFPASGTGCMNLPRILIGVSHCLLMLCNYSGFCCTTLIWQPFYESFLKGTGGLSHTWIFTWCQMYKIIVQFCRSLFVILSSASCVFMDILLKKPRWVSQPASRQPVGLVALALEKDHCTGMVRSHISFRDHISLPHFCVVSCLYFLPFSGLRTPHSVLNYLTHCSFLSPQARGLQEHSSSQVSS